MSVLDKLDPKPFGYGTFMEGDFLACAQWAITEPKIVAQFREDTGETWEPGRTPIEKMVDSATGATNGFCHKFLQWVVNNVWGPEGVEIDEPEPPQSGN